MKTRNRASSLYGLNTVDMDKLLNDLKVLSNYEFKDILYEKDEIPIRLKITDILYNDGVLFLELERGKCVLAMFHEQECYEDVELIDGLDDLQDKEGSILHKIECATTSGDVSDLQHETWTFIRFHTTKGIAILRWYGTSNGYYSESVGLYDITDKWLKLKDFAYWKEYIYGDC